MWLGVEFNLRILELWTQFLLDLHDQFPTWFWTRFDVSELFTMFSWFQLSLFFLLVQALQGAKELSSCSHQLETIQMSFCSCACFRYCSLLGFANNAIAIWAAMICHNGVRCVTTLDRLSVRLVYVGFMIQSLWHLTSVLFHSPCCPMYFPVSWKC